MFANQENIENLKKSKYSSFRMRGPKNFVEAQYSQYSPDSTIPLQRQLVTTVKINPRKRGDRDP